MQILALDTATGGCSVALWRNGDFAARRFREMARGQSEALLPMVADVLAEARTTPTDLDLLAVTRGPGAFTGLRIGLATARAMALATGLPCLGVATTDVVARGVDAGQITGELLVALDTKRNDFYVQKFAPDYAPLTSPQAMSPQALPELFGRNSAQPAVLVVGDAANRAIKVLSEAGVRSVLADAPGLPDAAHLAEIAAERWRPGDRPGPPMPLYLRPPDAKIPLNGGRLRPQKTDET